MVLDGFLAGDDVNVVHITAAAAAAATDSRFVVVGGVATIHRQREQRVVESN